MKRRLRCVAALALIAAAPPSIAETTTETRRLASDLGSLLASEQFCGLTYDQAAISAFITANAPPDDMGFAGLMQQSIALHGYSLADITGSAKAAHCTAITQTARHYGFIQ